MAQTTNLTGNAGDGVWETDANWDNGVPVSALDTVVACVVNNSGFPMSGPVAPLVVGSMDMEIQLEVYGSITIAGGGVLIVAAGVTFQCITTTLSSLSMLDGALCGDDGDGGGITVTGSLVVSAPSVWSGDASAVSSATFTGTPCTCLGTAGPGAYFSGGATNQGTIGDGYTFDDSAYLGTCNQNTGDAGDGGFFINGAINLGITGDHTLYESGSQNQGVNGDYPVYEDDSVDTGDDGVGVIFQDDSTAQNVILVSPSFFGASNVAGGILSGNVTWDSTGTVDDPYYLDITAATITASQPIALLADGGVGYIVQTSAVTVYLSGDATFSDFTGLGVLAGSDMPITLDQVGAAAAAAILADTTSKLYAPTGGVMLSSAQTLTVSSFSGTASVAIAGLALASQIPTGFASCSIVGGLLQVNAVEGGGGGGSVTIEFANE